MLKSFLQLVSAVLVFTFLSGYISLQALGQAESTSLSSGEVIFTDQEKGFVIINLGAEDAVEPGLSFEVYRNQHKIGVIKAVKVRQRFSAADIEYTNQNELIKVGDSLRPEADLSKSSEELFSQAQVGLRNKQADEEQDIFSAESEAFPGDNIFEMAEAKVQRILGWELENHRAQELTTAIEPSLQGEAGLTAENIVIDIDAPRRVILSVAIDVLKEHEFFITFSDPGKYTLRAFKNIELPLVMDFLSEYGPVARNKVYYTVQLQESSESQGVFANRLIIYLTEGYTQEGQLHSCRISSDSPHYREAQTLAIAIKDLAENL